MTVACFPDVLSLDKRKKNRKGRLVVVLLKNADRCEANVLNVVENGVKFVWWFAAVPRRS